MKFFVIQTILAMSIEISLQSAVGKTKSVVSFLHRIDCDSRDFNSQP